MAEVGSSMMITRESERNRLGDLDDLLGTDPQPRDGRARIDVELQLLEQRAWHRGSCGR